MFHGHKHHLPSFSHWVRATGKVLGKEVVPGPRTPHAKIVLVELRPEGAAPFQAKVDLIPWDHQHWEEDIYFPRVGDVRTFIFDPASGETRFDMTDPRNSMSANTAAGEAWAAAPDNDEPLKPDSGPPWLVGAICPYCSVPVDQRQATMQAQPQCMTCSQVLPAYPLVTSDLAKEALS
jgi:hypothetical protein